MSLKYILHLQKELITTIYGQWDAEIPGFWVAKYEMSMETSSDNKDWKNVQGGYIKSSKEGNVLTSSTITKSGIGKVTSFNKYPLTDDQIQQIANLCLAEQGSLEGAAAEASLMANIFEINNYSKLSKYGPGADGLFTFIKTSGWWADSQKIMEGEQGEKASKDYIKAVKSVLVDGKRILPLYVDEHDDKDDILSITTDGIEGNKTDKSQYVQFKTIITQNSKKIKGGGKYTYYGHFGADPFGYIKETNRTRYGEFHYDFSTGEAIKDPSTNKNIRAVSKPDVYSWNYIGVDYAYRNSKSYDEDNQSHLMKNSEWGAVAYLTHSQYGRNGRKIGINNNYFSILGYSKLTGYGSSSPTYTPAISFSNRYNGEYGRNASTTGNLYGVYDLSGGNNEYVASYFSKHENTTSYGRSLVEETSNSKNSTKYVTIYPGDIANISDNYESWKDIYGDAIYETSLKPMVGGSWFIETADSDSEKNEPFILRGGSYRDTDASGLFNYSDNEGVKNYENNGYRVVLISK
ncbi:MAG: formylglycine-generating enzyme family protein [Clostridia bacterium]|nr:formylglycine-generating enzyme family protein [Clostridia bacterium]